MRSPKTRRIILLFSHLQPCRRHCQPQPHQHLPLRRRRLRHPPRRRDAPRPARQEEGRARARRPHVGSGPDRAAGAGLVVPDRDAIMSRGVVALAGRRDLGRPPVESGPDRAASAPELDGEIVGRHDRCGLGGAPLVRSAHGAGRSPGDPRGARAGNLAARGVGDGSRLAVAPIELALVEPRGGDGGGR